MITKRGLEQEIISAYDRNICESFSINKISKILKKKYPYVNKKVSQLIEQKILLKTVVGKSYLCSLNLSNEKTILLLTLNEIEKRDKFLSRSKKHSELMKIIHKIKAEITMHTILINDNRTIIVLDDISKKSEIKKQLPGKIIFLDKESFHKELLSTSLLESHIILYGFEKYFEMVGEIEDVLSFKWSSLFKRKK